MIGTIDYFGKPHSDGQAENAAALLKAVAALRAEAPVEAAVDPDTGSEISGSRGGDGDGGFRTPSSQTGAAGSAHRRAAAVDVYDPGDRLDDWLTSFDSEDGARNSILEKHGLWREVPSATPGWCHLQNVPPASGRRSFLP